MAAPMKDSLSYFYCECHFDDKVELLKAEFGMKGLGILVTLWQKIYDNGYYCEWNDDVALMFSKSVNESVNVVSEVIGCAIRRGIFDRGMFDSRKILTSKGIQKRYLEASKRRKVINFERDYLLIDVPTDIKNVNINRNNVNINRNNVNTNSQSKRKESKVKENKVNNKLDVPAEIKPQWDAYVAMRKQLKKPLTQRAADLALSKLQKLAPNDLKTQGLILDQSVFNCWQGLFELKTEGGNSIERASNEFKPSRT